MIDILWHRSFFRRTLIALLGASFAMGMLALARAFAPTWPSGYVPLVLFAVAWEAAYTTDQLARPDWRFRRTLGFRLAELLVLFLLIRLITLGVQGRAPSLWLWLRRPGTFFDAEFIGVSLLAVVAWVIAVSSAGDFVELALRPDELVERPFSSREVRWDVPARPPQRTEVLARFSERWLWGGFVLVLLAALSRVNLGSLGRGLIGLARAGLPTDMVLALVTYFLGGLLLLSQGRLAVLRGRWQMQRAQGIAEVVARWPRYALAVVVGVALGALLLPLGSTWQLGRWLEIILFTLMQVFVALIGLLSALLGWLMGLLGWPSAQEAPTEEIEPFPLPTPAPEGGRRLSVPDWLSGSLFWLIVFVIVAYALMNYLGGRGLDLKRIVSTLREGWAFIWLWLRRRTREALAQARATWARLVQAEAPYIAPPAPWRFLRLRALSPRERVRFYYLAALRRAAEHGVRRPPAATPLEHAPLLDASWPEAQEGWEYLTAEFVKARYTPEPIEPEEAKGVQRVWEEVKAILRGRKGLKA
jgi:hypothetical protein